MKELPFDEEFLNYLRASYPALWIRTHEETRVIRSIVTAVSDRKIPVNVYCWDSKRLLEKHNKGANAGSAGNWERVPPVINAQNPALSKTYALNDIIDNLRDMESAVGVRNVFILKDFHSYIEAPGQTRPIRNAIEKLKTKGNMLVFVSPIIKIPVELEKEIQILEFSLPNEIQLAAILQSVMNIFNTKQKHKKEPEEDITADVRQASIEAAKGLTFNEAHDAFSIGIITHKKFNNLFVNRVFEEKAKQVKKNGLLQYVKPDVDFEGIGGLEGIKKWLRARSNAYTSAARDYGLPYPKGILLCGIPGCGKTTLAKAIAAEFGFPLYVLDIGSLFGKYVGESEENFRKVIETIEGLGRCVLFIDEIEKSLNKEATSGKGDTGTSSRSFATLLSWLSEHKSPVFVVATSNDHTKLPPEFTRKGRFDEMFWLDLPSEAERVQIASVLLKRYNRDPLKFNLEKIAQKSVDFTGAEIEQAIIGAMFAAFSKKKEVTFTDIEDELNVAVPIARTSAVDIATMRENAENKLRIASDSGASKIFTIKQVATEVKPGTYPAVS